MAICVPRSSETQAARIQRVSFRQAATDLRRGLAEQCQDRFGLPVCKEATVIAERRIRFVHVGRHVRIPESALGEFIGAGLVEPMRRSRGSVA